MRTQFIVTLLCGVRLLISTPVCTHLTLQTNRPKKSVSNEWVRHQLICSKQIILSFAWSVDFCSDSVVHVGFVQVVRVRVHSSSILAKILIV